MDLNLSHRVVIITGAASGIGKAAALAFARHGARVVAADINEDGGREVVARIEADPEARSGGGAAVFVRTDVSLARDAEALAQAALERWGTIDVLYNNAATTTLCNQKDRSVHELEEWVWDKMIGVCLKGVYLCSKFALPPMIRAGRGAIINTASCDAVLAEAGYDSYTAAKGGVIALTRSMAAAYGRHGIRVNVISPGYVITECQLGWYQSDPEAVAKARSYHLTRLGQPEDVANMALYLASDRAGFITGATIPVDGGFTAFKASDAAAFIRTREQS